MRRIDLLSSSILLGLSLFTLIASRKFQVWVMGEPGEGFFPVLLALTLGALSIISFFTAYGSRSASPLTEPGGPPIIWKKLLCYILALFAYALLFSPLGYIVSSLMILVFILRGPKD